MRRAAGYALLGLLFVGAAVALVWPWLDAGSRSGVLAAAGIALPVQVVAFGLLERYRNEEKAFLTAWVGGTLARLALVVVAAVMLAWRDPFPPVPTLLALAGFLFGLLVLETVFLVGPLRPKGGPEGAGAPDAGPGEDGEGLGGTGPGR